MGTQRVPILIKGAAAVLQPPLWGIRIRASIGRSSDFSKTARNLGFNAKKKKPSVIQKFSHYSLSFSLFLPFLDMLEANSIQAKQNKSMVLI